MMYLRLNFLAHHRSWAHHIAPAHHSVAKVVKKFDQSGKGFIDEDDAKVSYW